MKIIIIASLLLMALTTRASFASTDHGSHGSASIAKSAAAHEETIDGVKVTFTIQTMKEALKSMGMEMPKGVKETHHIQIRFVDTKSGRTLTNPEVAIKVMAPDKSEQIKSLSAMQGHFGADFTMPVKGKYGVMCKFRLADGKERQSKFWYQIR